MILIRRKHISVTVFPKLLLASLVFISTTRATAQANLLINGNFETGTVNNWTPNPNLNNPNFWGWNVYALPYNYYAVLNNGDATGNYYVYQDITAGVQSGKTYALTGVAATHAAASGTAGFYLEFYNTNNQLLATSARAVVANDFQNIGFQAFASIIVAAPTNTTKIRVVAHSNGRALKFDNLSLITCGGNVETICYGGRTTLAFPKTNLSLNTTFQWQSAPDNANWTNITGATADTFTTAALTQSTFFRVLINSGDAACPILEAEAAQIVVVADPSVSIVGATTVCQGGTATLTATATGGTGTCGLQWQDSHDGTTWTDISGATNSTYTTPALTANKYFRTRYTCSGANCNQAFSNIQQVQVVADPSVVVTASANAVCVGGTVVYNAAVWGGTSDCRLQWQSLNGGTWTDISGATNNTYTAANLTTNVQFRARLNCTTSGCCN
jgi:hypothetical protein